ncbi:Muscle M-line assembly protein unc-89-like 2, partial [Homarus americanus]
RAQQYSDSMDAAERAYTDNVMPNDAEGARQLLSSLHDHKRSVLEASMYTLQEAQALLARLRGLSSEGATLDSRPLQIKTNIEFACSQIEHYLESLHDRRRFLDGLFSARKHHLEQCLALCLLYQDLTEAVTALKQLRDEVSQHQGLGESQSDAEFLYHEHIKREIAAKALTKLDQAEVQVASLGGEGAQRLSLVLGVVEEAVQPALTEGYAILEVTGGRSQPHNMGISLVVEELERRRSHLSSVCVSSTEQVLQRTELSNAFLEQYNTIESWLVRIGDAFLQGHQDPGGSLSLAKDFLHLHQTLNHDVMEKKNEIEALSTFLEKLLPDLSAEEGVGYQEKIRALQDHWIALKKLIDLRIGITKKYVKFHEDAEAVNNEHEALELLLKEAKGEDRGAEVEAKWEQVQKLYLDLCNTGKAFCQDVKGMHFEMSQMETDFCPLLRGDTTDPEGMANTLVQRLNVYVSAVKKTQEDIQNMMTKAEVMSYKGDEGGQRDEVIGSLLQLYQNLQNKATEYQILGHMLIQWCRNIAEIHRSCDKLESQFSNVSLDIGGVEGQLREHEASKQAVLELLKFAQNEANSIVSKIRDQCPPEAGAQDIAVINELLKRRGTEFEKGWLYHQHLLERQLRRSQYHVDLQVISDQLRDLSEQLSRMRGHYGDSLAAATNMQTAFNHFQLTVDMLEKRIQTFVTTTTKMLGPEDDSGEVQEDLAELEKKWSTFQMQVGQSKKSIELSIVFYKLVEEAEDWVKQGGELLVDIAGDSSNIQTPEQAEKLRTRIENFLKPEEEAQQQRITKLSSLALQLYGAEPPRQIEVVNHQNTQMIDSFTVINRNLIMLVENLRSAEDHRERQKKEKEEMAASLAAAQAEAGAARLATIAAEEARKAAEEVAIAMAIPIEPIVPEKVEIEIQTEAIPLPDEEPSRQEDTPPLKKAKLIDDEPQPMPPVFLTPLVGATVTEGVKFTFEVLGMPMPEVEWLKDNMSITANPDYKTSYEEEAEPVEVLAPPSFTKRLVDSTAQEGATYQLEATVEGHPLPVVSWAKDGNCIDESPDYVITFNNAVEVSERPKFTMPLSNVMARAGQKFKLECHVTGLPSPTVTWFHNSKPVKETPDCRIAFDGRVATLVMSEAFPKNAGTYTVVAKNSAGEGQCSANVSVKGRIPTETSDSEVTSDIDVEPVKPSVQLPLKDTNVMEGKSARLDCVIVGQPEPEVIWYHDDKPVKESSDFKLLFHGDRCSLIIQEAFLEDAGIYRVVAMNSAGEASTACFLNVEPVPELTPPPAPEPPAVAPRFSLLLADNHVTEGNPVTLRATVTGQPKPTIAWFREGMPLIPDNELQIHESSDGSVSATIHAATLDHTGQYEIVASNTAGTAKCVAYLSIEPRLPTPPPAEQTEPPVFTKLITDVTVTSGCSAKFEAEVMGLPTPTVSDSNFCKKTFSNINDNSDIFSRGDGETEQKSNLNQVNNGEVDELVINAGDASDLDDIDLGIESSVCSSVNVLGKSEFAEMMSKFSQLGCFPFSEENESRESQVTQKEEVKSCDKYESTSNLSTFHNMKILDIDTYSRFMMENIVVYGSLDDSENPESSTGFDQFHKFNDVAIMTSEDYSNLIVSDCESTDVTADVTDKVDVSTGSGTLTPTPEEVQKPSCFLDTGISESLQPIKLADLWSLIKDKLPNPEDDSPDKKNEQYFPFETDTDSNRKSTSLSSDGDLESGYFSGNFSSNTAGSESTVESPRSGLSKRNSCTFSSSEEPSRKSSPSEDKLLVFPKVSKNSPEEEDKINWNLTDESLTSSDYLNNNSVTSLKLSSKDIKERQGKLDPQLTGSKRISTESTQTCGRELKSIIESPTDFDAYTDSCNNNIISAINDKYKDAYISSVDLSLDVSTVGIITTPPEIDEEIPLYKLNKKCRKEIEQISGSMEVTVNRFHTPVQEHVSEYLRCPSSLSVISEESYFSDFEDTSKDSNDSNSIEDNIFIESLKVDPSEAGYNMRKEINIVCSESVHVKDELSFITNDTDMYEIERRARRAARLAKLRELTKVLQTPSKISASSPNLTTDSHFLSQIDITSLKTSTPYTENFISANQLLTDFADNSQQKEAIEMQSQECNNPSAPSKALLFIIKTVERLSQIEIKKIIIEKLDTIIEAGQAFIRAYVFPFSHAAFIDLDNPSLMQQTFNTLSGETAHNMVFETCLHATRGQGAIIEGECMDQETPHLVQAGYYLIYVMYYKGVEETTNES